MGEDCDDGAESSTCDEDCTLAECGDEYVNAPSGETCDAAGETALCNDDCTAADCGDGKLNATAGEQCDDGANVGGDGCSAYCIIEGCGNGVVDLGEDCDDAGDSATCDADCSPAECGDAYVNAPSGESCDAAGESALCNVDCTAADCGDGKVNATSGEQCDDAGASASCDADCTTASCGDGVTNPGAGEDCDDAGESASCNADCTTASCGDGVVNVSAGEKCDDMNSDPADGCDMCVSAYCTVEYALTTAIAFTGGLATLDPVNGVGSMVVAYTRDPSMNIIDGPVSTLFFWVRAAASISQTGFFSVSFTYNMFAPTCGGDANPDPLDPPAACTYDGNPVPLQTGLLSGSTIAWDACTPGPNYWTSSAYAPTLDPMDTANFNSGPGCLNGARWSGEYTCTESLAGSCMVFHFYEDFAVGNYGVDQSWNQPFILGTGPGVSTLAVTGGGTDIASPIDADVGTYSYAIPDISGAHTFLRFTGTAVAGPNTTCNLP